MIVAIAAAMLAAQTSPAPGGDYRDRGGENATLSVTLENDYFASTDRNYTNGLRVAYVSAPRPQGGYAGFLARRILRQGPGGEVRVGYAAGQSIYTPEDTETVDLLPDQHPYAGWLYAEHSVIAVDRLSFQRLTTQVGVVGPSAGAENAQNSYHEWIGGREVRGWRNQLEDEFGFAATYEKGRVLFDTPELFGLESDATLIAGATAGNVLTEGKIGGMVRFGRNLASDAGPPRVRPALAGGGFFDKSVGSSWYVFVGAQGRAVAWNIFLDGNSFAGDREPQVERRQFVADLQAGAVARIGRVQFAYQFVTRTEEFETQTERQAFGAISAAVAF